MSAITSSIGLISGLNTQEIVDALINAQRATVRRLEQRVTAFKAKETGLKALEASLLTLTTTIQSLGNESTFKTYNTTNTDAAQLKAVPGIASTAGTYQLQSLRLASTHSVLSKGFANSDTQAVGAGTITIANGGGLLRETSLDSLNGGTGVRRGTIRITDRSGAIADIDLKSTYTVEDVVAAINASDDVAVTASAEGGKIVLRDSSGSTTSNLIVKDIAGGHAAEDLGINQSVASNTLTGSDVFSLTADFPLDQINDGNGLRLLSGAPHVKFTLSDDSTIEVNLDNAASINDVLNKINNDDENGGKLLAELQDGRIKLTDQSGGGGSSTFSVENLNDSNVTSVLGLDVAASGNEITGRKLSAGMNSVLLRNLRGGQGITQTGQISLSDRTGTTATIDLSGAESLDEVLTAINSAETGGGVKLQLFARVNDAGTGIVIEDTSGSTASNLIIADVGGGTLAADLNIDVNAAQTSVDSGSLHLRYVNEATSLSNYAPDGGGIESGSFLLVDSQGNGFSIGVTTGVKNVGDLIQRINLGQKNLTGQVGIQLANLRDGQGIDQLGELNVTDRTGQTATIDLSTAESLNDVINAINSATTSGGDPLFLNAKINATGDGIIVSDTSGSTAGNLVIADGVGSTLAAQLGIAVDGAVSAIDSGSLNHRSVRAELNETGDGFVLIDEAGGTDQLHVEELGKSTGADLRLLGDSVVGSDGKQRISSRFATIIETDADDTLEDLVEKLNASGGFASAAVFDDGSAFNSFRLSLTSKQSGAKGRLLIETSGLDLSLTESAAGEDALMRTGGSTGSGFVVASSSNTFENFAGDVRITLSAVSDTPATVTVFRDDSKIKAALQKMVTNYNAFVDQVKTATSFNLDANTKGVLQGEAVVVRMQSRLESMFNKRYGEVGGEVSTLFDVGIQIGAGGKLEFNETRFDDKIASDPQAVSKFFTDADKGFGKLADQALDALVDPLTGTFALESNSITESLDSLSARIESLEGILTLRRERLLVQFNNMENILGKLTSQQAAIGQISGLSVRSVGKGIL